MRIIKPGKTPEEMDPEKEVTCWRCKAVLGYKVADILSNIKNDVYIECPCCKAFVDVDH